MRRELYSFIILVLISIILSVLAVMVTLYEIRSNNHKFCQVIHSATTVPIPKPKDPSANPSRQRSFVGYTQFVMLGRSLGCGSPQSGKQQ